MGASRCNPDASASRTSADGSVVAIAVNSASAAGSGAASARAGRWLMTVSSGQWSEINRIAQVRTCSFSCRNCARRKAVSVAPIA